MSLPQASPEQESAWIKKLNEQGAENSVKPFQNIESLPTIVRVHVATFIGIEDILERISPLFAESVKRLREWDMERIGADFQPGKLSKSFADFLSEVTKYP